MFGSQNPFGQSSSSPFGSPSVFGQTSSSSTTNPFAPKPFGSSNPFGSPVGSSPFGVSTGMFGAPASTPGFGASSAPAFGSSTSPFGAQSTPSFGGSSSSFGGSSMFGQKPTFAGFGSTSSQPSPFGSSFQQTQPALGSSPFGSSTFGSSSQPAFGAANTSAFGSSSTPSFGSTAAPAFGSSSIPGFGTTNTPVFGATSAPSFGSTSTSFFGSSGTAFGGSSAPAFGSTGTPGFGTPNTLFGTSSTSTPAFGSSSTPALGTSSSPFSFSTPFGQSASTSGSTPFGTTQSPFGSQVSPFGAQTTTPTFGSPGFGQAGFGGQQGSRVVPYSATTEVDGGTQPGKLVSIAAMPAYKEKSHEELRWEDYQRGDKGGPSPSVQPSGGTSFPSPTTSNPFGSTSTFGQPAASPFGSTSTFGQPAASPFGSTSTFGQPAASPFSSTSTFGQTAANPFSSTTASNPFASKTPFGSSGFGTTTSSPFNSTFGSSSSSPFGSTSSTPSLFTAPSNTAFGSSSSPSLFGGTTSTFSTPIFGSTSASTSAFSSGLNFGNTQSSGLFQSSTPSLGQSQSPFGQPTGFQQATSAFGSSFNTPSTGFGGNLFGSSSSAFSTNTSVGFGQTTPSMSTPFQLSTPAQTAGAFSFGNFGQAQLGGFGGSSSISSQNTFGQPGATQSNVVMQPPSVTNPFGTLPPVPRLSIGRVGSVSSVHYGISSMPVSEQQLPVKISPLLTPRHLSLRTHKLPPRKYHPKVDGPKVPFFSNDETAAATPKADALFTPRENPRLLFIRPTEQWPPRTNSDKQTIAKDLPANGNERPLENGDVKKHNDAHLSSSSNPSEKSNVVPDNHVDKETNLSSYNNGEGVKALMPKFSCADYYTEPSITELEAKELSEPGFCCRVKDFVVGRHGFGSINFFGETDVRRLDLNSVVEFYLREVIVYKDEGKKPPVGQGLNKAAEVTLLNIKCTNKKTGEQFTEGPRVEKFKQMLIRKTEEQKAEFVSFDPVKGEWKFRVKHF